MHVPASHRTLGWSALNIHVLRTLHCLPYLLSIHQLHKGLLDARTV